MQISTYLSLHFSIFQSLQILFVLFFDIICIFIFQLLNFTSIILTYFNNFSSSLSIRIFVRNSNTKLQKNCTSIILTYFNNFSSSLSIRISVRNSNTKLRKDEVEILEVRNFCHIHARQTDIIGIVNETTQRFRNIYRVPKLFWINRALLPSGRIFAEISFKRLEDRLSSTVKARLKTSCHGLRH